MQLQRKAWRNFVLAAALVTFALPLAGPLSATSARAQGIPGSLGQPNTVPTACTPSTATTTNPVSAGSISTTCYVAAVNPNGTAEALNPIGTPHTATFICDALTSGLYGAGGTAIAPTTPPGCYDVQASVAYLLGGAPPITQATCGNVVAPASGSTVTCAGVASPICPVGTVPAPTPGPTTPCTTPSPGETGYVRENTASVTINPGAQGPYTITFSGYIPTTSLGSCPTGTTFVPGISLTESFGNPPSHAVLPASGACSFSVEVNKKYAEITNIILVPTAPCGGTLFYAEGLKAFFGPKCTVTAYAVGQVPLKTEANCPAALANIGTPPANPYGPQQPAGSPIPSPAYTCVNGTLYVTNAFIPNAPLTFTATGASFNVLNTLGSACSGVIGVTTASGTSGVPITLCATGPGGATVSACLSLPLPNNQPQVCSTPYSFQFTQVARRVVPQVRWAGEKIALTKCFGVGLGGATVEFTLMGNNPGLDATLIPTDLDTTLGATGNVPSNSTVWAVTDPNGCATVLGYANGEGQLLVDASIFSNGTTPGGIRNPLVNEHAFEVFYLKFDHLDLENINPAVPLTTANGLTPYASWIAGSPDVYGATTFPTPNLGSAGVQRGSTGFPTGTLPSAPLANMEVAGATGFSVPLCQTQFIRSMVHGYFEIPGDPSGRPATNVAIPGAPLTSGGSPSAGSYVLPAGRWVLPEDWPVLATFAGFSGTSPADFTPSSVYAWDLNSGYVFNPAGENPVYCTGTANTPEPVDMPGSLAGSVDQGPCSSQDHAGTLYETAPTGNCAGGITVGFSGFDPLQSCTNPTFPLTYAPSGATIIGGVTGAPACPGGAAGPCLVPAGINSNYLPNGTLNQWDAPMPPAQVSFGITSGFGFLNQVNKTGLYALTFDLGSDANGCPTGYVANATTGTCQLTVNPDPFYSTAIPASPFIPQPFNNGGYLWNSYNFSAGTVTAVPGTGVFGAPAGGFVPGQSTTATVPINVSGGVAACPTTIFATQSGTNCIIPGGTNVTTCVTNGTNDSVIVANGGGFLVGMTLEKYDFNTGATIATTGLTIQAVLPSPQPGFPNAVELVLPFGALTGLCGGAAPFTEVFMAQQFGIPVPSAAAFQIGETITLGNGGGTTATVTIVAIDSTANIIYVSSTEGIAGIFGGGCLVSRAGGPGGFCEPSALVPAGTLVQGGPVGAVGAGGTSGLAAGTFGPPPNPYPFWQWVPAAAPATGAPQTATVYSDNHGEADVSLSTGINLSAAPVAGVCPSGFKPVTFQGTLLDCRLPFSSLGAAGLTNISAALAAFTAAKPGCIQTFPSGTTAVVPTPSNGLIIGASGPAAGQICVNGQGGLEFGASATLGSTTVNAIADYPYTRGIHPPIGSAPLTKIFTSAFAKTLTVSAGTPAPAGTTSYTVTVTAVDVCGNFLNEPVQVIALGNAGAVALTPTSNVGQILASNGNSSVVTVNPATGQAVLSLEVLNSAIGTQGLVIKAIFPFENVERFVTVIPGSTPGAVVNVPYAPGWNMVGGPANSNFGVAEALFSYDATAANYVNATASAGSLSSAAPACSGYWAYFAAPMVVSLQATSHSGDTAACTLVAGWNLVGNPFATPATLPSGVQGYHWNGTSYDLQGVVPVGGSLWIFNDGTHNSLTLTAS